VKNRIFLDTSYILALTNSRDQYHEQASQLVGRFAGYPTLVTDGVLLEIGNALARSHRQEATRVIRQLLTSDEVEIIHVTSGLLEQGLTLYSAHQDKTWSLVDCISFVVMREAGVTGALTFDRHFEQAGFQVLMSDN
jgi:uncharacterized protein